MMPSSRSTHLCLACLQPIEKPEECLRCALIGALTALDYQQNGRHLPDMEHLNRHESRWLLQSAPMAPAQVCQAA